MTKTGVNTVFISFGAGRTGWRHAVQRISKEARMTKLFSETISLDEGWLKDVEPEIYKNIQRFHAHNFYKGFGYMTWKPAVLKWAKQQYPNANILYMDSGSHIDNSQKQIDLLKKLLSENADRGLAWKLPFHQEISWTKKELLIKLAPSKDILQTGQIQSNFIYIPNTSLSNELLHRWNHLAVEKKGFYFSDELEINQNPEFIAHRHDQSAFSILWKMLGFGVMDDMTYPENLGNYPVVAMRNNTGFSATSSNRKLAATRNFNVVKDRILRRR